MNVLDLDIKLRTVECSLTDTDLVIDAKVVKDVAHHCLSFVPLLFSTDILSSVIKIPL